MKKKLSSIKTKELDDYIVKHQQIHDTIKKQIDAIDGKLNSILNVQVNGRVGLQESLQDIYNLTKELRNKRNLLNNFEEWKKVSTIGKVLSTKVGKTLFYTVNVFIAASVLYTLRIIDTNPVELIGSVFTAILKVI